MRIAIAGSSGLIGTAVTSRLREEGYEIIRLVRRKAGADEIQWDPQKGGLLYARFGKGIYIYNAYAFYRQLPEGVAGAYRIMANLVSLPKNPAIKAVGGKQK